MSILGLTKQAVSKRHLLALTTGRVAFPAFQVTSSGVVTGLPVIGVRVVEAPNALPIASPPHQR